MNIIFFFNFQDILTQTRQKNKQLKSYIKKGIEFLKKNMNEKLQKVEGDNKWLTKYINNMRAVNNISALSLREKGSKTIEDIKRQTVLMEEENIKMFNEEKNINQRKFKISHSK